MKSSVVTGMRLKIGRDRLTGGEGRRQDWTVGRGRDLDRGGATPVWSDPIGQLVVSLKRHVCKAAHLTVVRNQSERLSETTGSHVLAPRPSL